MPRISDFIVKRGFLPLLKYLDKNKNIWSEYPFLTLIPYEIAIENGHLDCLKYMLSKYMLSKKIDKDYKDVLENKILCVIAVQYGQLEILKYHTAFYILMILRTEQF